jgi:hypothetical protein
VRMESRRASAHAILPNNSLKQRPNGHQTFQAKSAEET